MIFCHIFDDFYLQGQLANFKQKRWWADQAYIMSKKEEDLYNMTKKYYNKYRHDYIIALIIHAFSWAFMISLPLWVYSFLGNDIIQPVLVVTMIINTILHAYIDNLKANKLKLNLVQDQILHIDQVVGTWLMCMVLLMVKG